MSSPIHQFQDSSSHISVACSPSRVLWYFWIHMRTQFVTLDTFPDAITIFYIHTHLLRHTKYSQHTFHMSYVHFNIHYKMYRVHTKRQSCIRRAPPAWQWYSPHSELNLKRVASESGERLIVQLCGNSRFTPAKLSIHFTEDHLSASPGSAKPSSARSRASSAAKSAPPSAKSAPPSPKKKPSKSKSKSKKKAK